MKRRAISLDQYNEGFNDSARTSRGEWKHAGAGGRAKAFMQLSPKGESWARAEDLLPKQTAAQKPRQT
jgi:hypothetical protein